MTVEYKNLNSIRLAEPPHHRRQRSAPFVLPSEYTPGYPVPSTTNQRRITLKAVLLGHRGTHAAGRKPILRKLPADENGHRATEPVGIWRGLDHRLAKSLGSRYTGEKLRAIRAIKGVGRPWVTLLSSALETEGNTTTGFGNADNSATTS